MQGIDELNGRFGRGEEVSFGSGSGGLAVAALSNRHGSAIVSLHGGQVLDYTPRGQRPVLWVSSKAVFAGGKAIRGGIPVCWPWFGPHRGNAELPAHGFARNALWEVAATDGGGQATSISLALHPAEAMRALWPHAFSLTIKVTLAEALQVALSARNTGESPVTCTAALHSYFAVSDINSVQITGLEGVQFRDQLDGDRIKVENGPIRFSGETDRVYRCTTGDCVIEDSGWGRAVRVAKSGSRSTVVWNPWFAKAARMSDFGDAEFRDMVCVETANADDDAVEIGPGRTHTLATSVSATAPGAPA